MRYLLIISTLTTSLMFSAASRAEWNYVTGAGGDKTYVDFERIRTVNGLVYYWEITDKLEPSSTGALSYKVYSKVDCETLRKWELSFTTYKLPMAEGDGHTLSPDPDPQWQYAQPGSVLEATLQAVCNH